MSKTARVEIPLYLMHETDPKPLHSAILAKLEVLEQLEYEISGVDNILMQQTDTIRAAKPASADAYIPKIQALQEELRRLKTEEKRAMDKQRAANVQIQELRAPEERTHIMAEAIVDEHLRQLANRNSRRGSASNGKCAVSSETRRQYDLHRLHSLAEEEKGGLDAAVKELKDKQTELQTEEKKMEYSYFHMDDKQVKLLDKLENISSLYEKDIDLIKADIVRQENFINIYQSKIKELEFKRLVEVSKIARRQASTAQTGTLEHNE